MDEALKFKLKTFVYYLLIEPWTEKVAGPSLKTASWILVFAGWAFRLSWIFFSGIILLAIVYVIKEYKSGKFIYWYRQRLYKKTKDEKKKMSKMQADEIPDETLQDRGTPTPV